MVSSDNSSVQKILNIGGYIIDDGCCEENTIVEDAMYSIADQDNVCLLQLINPANRKVASWSPGSTIIIRLDFSEGVQACRSVNTRLIQCENHPNGSRIQEKVLGASSRSAVDAVVVNMSFQIPSDAPCEFTSPLFAVRNNFERSYIF